MRNVRRSVNALRPRIKERYSLAFTSTLRGISFPSSTLNRRDHVFTTTLVQHGREKRSKFTNDPVNGRTDSRDRRRSSENFRHFDRTFSPPGKEFPFRRKRTFASRTSHGRAISCYANLSVALVPVTRRERNVIIAPYLRVCFKVCSRVEEFPRHWEFISRQRRQTV